MIATRPDWCISRQRLWGVPITAFYCKSCGKVVMQGDLCRRVADLFEKESADAWYEREAKDLLPPGFACPDCGKAEFDKEKDILDVWFDSGSSHAAVLGHRKDLPWPADVYLEERPAPRLVPFVAPDRRRHPGCRPIGRSSPTASPSTPRAEDLKSVRERRDTRS